MQGGCIGFLRERPTVLAQTCPRKDAPARHRWPGFSVTTPASTGDAVFLSDSAGGVGSGGGEVVVEMASPRLSSRGRGTYGCHCSGVSQASSDPCLNLSVPWPLAGLVPHFSCVLSLASSWNSKLHVLKDPARHRPTLLPQRRASEHCI